MTICYIGIGSNLGDRLDNIEKAISLLSKIEGVTVKRRSRIYETEPEGGPQHQGDYFNLVLELESGLSARELLKALKSIEQGLGRGYSKERWSAREIDLDILLYSDSVIESDDLRIPHPLMHKRFFVLKPLSDLAPGARHPVLGLTVSDMLEALKKNSRPAKTKL